MPVSGFTTRGLCRTVKDRGWKILPPTLYLSIALSAKGVITNDTGQISEDEHCIKADRIR